MPRDAVPMLNVPDVAATAAWQLWSLRAVEAPRS